MKKLFYNGEVITADKTDSVHQAILIEDDKIAFVGSTQKALKYLDEEANVIIEYEDNSNLNYIGVIK